MPQFLWLHKELLAHTGSDVDGNNNYDSNNSSRSIKNITIGKEHENYERKTCYVLVIVVKADDSVNSTKYFLDIFQHFSL
jgi:hypothetical protein